MDDLPEGFTPPEMGEMPDGENQAPESDQNNGQSGKKFF